MVEKSLEAAFPYDRELDRSGWVPGHELGRVRVQEGSKGGRKKRRGIGPSNNDVI